MNTLTVIYIFLAILFTSLLVFFQYFFKEKKYLNRNILAFLRFFSILSVLLLLINPKVLKTNYDILKPKLLVVVDNSASIKYTNQDSIVTGIVKKVENDANLNAKFDIQYFSLGNTLQNNSNFTFEESQTNIYEALKGLNSTFKQNVAPILLLSDGNQTFGSNYKYYNSKQPVYPVIIGDTLTYSDLVLDQLNVNSYTYLNNNFQVEAFIHYTGNDRVNTNFIVEEGNKIIYKEKIAFSQDNKIARLNFKLPSGKVGKHLYSSKIKGFVNERNKLNNFKNFSVEVIDEQINIGLIYDVLHPDIAMLKRSIETNKQRKVNLINLNLNNNYSDDNKLFILYQPTNNFKKIFNHINNLKTNYFIITGRKTDWVFLNSIQKDFKKVTSNSIEQSTAIINNNFNAFHIDDIGFSNFSPLDDIFGEIKINVDYQILLYQSINGIITDAPLLATYSGGNKRRVVLFGENIWKWRAISYSNNQTFEIFDQFINSMMQYLTIANKNNSIELDYKSFYYDNEPIHIIAKIYDKNLNFNSKENLEIQIEGQDNKTTFFLSGNTYEANLPMLKSGDYKFVVSNKLKNNQTSGAFTIANYSIENKDLTADIASLNSLALNSNGKIYYPDKIDNLLQNLTENKEFLSIQKENKKIISLINWKWLLGIIILSLSLEWFIRKYRGLV